jgi:hypothetical protein
MDNLPDRAVRGFELLDGSSEIGFELLTPSHIPGLRKPRLDTALPRGDTERLGSGPTPSSHSVSYQRQRPGHPVPMIPIYRMPAHYAALRSTRNFREAVLDLAHDEER